MKRLAFVGGVLVVALFAAVAARASIDEPDPVVIVHWANSHPMREGLLPEMAEEFNKEDHKTADGRPIKVVMIACDSSDQAADLVERVGGPSSEADCHSDSGDSAPDPTIITPQADDWLLDVNHGAGGRDVIDLDSTDSIAETYMGIVTYRAMAECLGWPNRELGYADIIPVLEEGWDAYPGCTPELDWRDPPRVAFTNPNTSTSGRNVLVSLFAMYADNTSPEDLTVEDIEDPGVLGDVKSFQALLDHYMAATSLVNTRIAGGPEYGSFFLMPEDNLANLLLGNETQIGTDGKKQSAEAPEDELVMIYPKEGAVLNSNPAAFVDAPWVTHEQSEGARSWIDYVRDDQQQQRFMDMGFRPATGLDVDDEKFTAWGLEPSAPKSIIDPGALKADVLQAILDSWGEVKKPAIVTFVVDVSGSMDGEPIEQVKDGLIEVLKSMKGPDSAGQNSQVGLVMFYGEGDDGDVPVVDVKVEPGPLEDVQRRAGRRDRPDEGSRRHTPLRRGAQGHRGHERGGGRRWRDPSRGRAQRRRGQPRHDLPGQHRDDAVAQRVRCEVLREARPRHE